MNPSLLKVARLRVLQLLVPLAEPLPLRVHDRQQGGVVGRCRRLLHRHRTLEELLFLSRGEVLQGVGHQNVGRRPEVNVTLRLKTNVLRWGTEPNSSILGGDSVGQSSIRHACSTNQEPNYNLTRGHFCEAPNKTA